MTPTPANPTQSAAETPAAPRRPAQPPRVKVCCIASVEEARLAHAHGASALGLVSAMPSGPGVVSDAVVAEVAAAARGMLVGGQPMRTFLLTARTRADDIAAQHAFAGTTTLQLVDAVSVPELQRLRRLCPGVELVQVVHVTGPEAVGRALAVAPWVDAVLLDSGNPALAIKQLGGTGRTHDWRLSQHICNRLHPQPVWLAGGLRADNVAQAWNAVQPQGLDVCTGVRHNGALDAARLAGFMAATAALGSLPWRAQDQRPRCSGEAQDPDQACGLNPSPTGPHGAQAQQALSRPEPDAEGQAPRPAQHQRELASSAWLLKRASEMAGVGAWALDLKRRTPIWSEQTRRIHEVDASFQPTADTAINFFHPRARAALRAAVHQAAAGGPGWDLELPMTTARGRSIWVRVRGQAEWVAGKPVRLVGSVEDISVRREAEIRLQRSRQMLRVLYESSPAMMLSVDSAGRVLTVTDCCLEFLGGLRGAVVGRPVAEFVAPQDAPRWAHSVLPAIFNGTPLVAQASQVRRLDGSLREVRLSSVMVRDEEDQPRRALIVMEDFSAQGAHWAELRREQQERQRLEDHAHVLQRLLKERDDMLDVLAHEVRQPLNNASAALQSATAALQGTGEERALERLQRAQKVLADVLSGVDNTLAASALLAAAGSAARQAVELETLLGFVVADLPLEQRARVQVLPDADLDEVTVDLGLMRLALRNLLANALKYSPAPLAVALRVGVLHEPRAQPRVVWDVVDQGPGFTLTHGQDPFARGSRGATGGNGLGLYIAHRVMELHGGSIELIPNPGKGSTVRLSVPL